MNCRFLVFIACVLPCILNSCFSEALHFPSEEVEEIAPAAVAEWKLVADTQSVPWQLIMLMEVHHQFSYIR